MSLTLIRRYADLQWNIAKIYRTSESNPHHHRHLSKGSIVSINKSIGDDDEPSSKSIINIDILTPGYQKFTSQAEESPPSSPSSSPSTNNGTPSYSNNQGAAPSYSSPQHNQHISTSRPEYEHEHEHKFEPKKFIKPFRRQNQIQPPSTGKLENNAKIPRSDSSGGRRAVIRCCGLKHKFNEIDGMNADDDRILIFTGKKKKQ